LGQWSLGIQEQNMTNYSDNGTPPQRPPAYPPEHQGAASHAPQAGAQNEQNFLRMQLQQVGQEERTEFIKLKKRPNRVLRLMQFLMSLSFFVSIVLAGFFMYTRLQIDKPGPLATATLFEVGKGQGLSSISARLQQKGIIKNKRMFALNTVANKAAKKLKAGKFHIPARASMQEVLDILVRGRAIFYKVTVPEGLTSQQVVLILNKHPQLKGTIDAIPAEGSLMPNTYQFDADTERSEILAKMSKNQREFLAKSWANRQKDLPLQTPQEALILASIVEKETGIASERKRVAGVFINRLRKGIKLQSDPTIIYGLVGGKGKLGHPLRQSEMKKKTGFNTYHIAGLPPTPIANPGSKAIEAVLNPADTKDLFFVADGSGGHAFAPTLKQHNINVRAWRKVEAKKRAEQKRKIAEKNRAALLEKKTQEKKAVALPKPVKGIKLTGAPIAINGKNGWGNVPLPVRKPH